MRLSLLVEVVEDATRVAALAQFLGRNVDGLRLACCDDLGERLIALHDETGCAPAHCPEFRTAAVIFHINDGSPGNGLDRCAELSARYDFRNSVHNPDGCAKDGGSVEDQGGKEESRG